MPAFVPLLLRVKRKLSELHCEAAKERRDRCRGDLRSGATSQHADLCHAIAAQM